MDYLKQTDNTITDKESLLTELRKIKNQGYGVEIQENETGISCIAAPIFDSRGSITAAVSVSGPSIRMDDSRLKALSPTMIDVAKKISQRLGYIVKST